jgi:hypothetical protein
MTRTLTLTDYQLQGVVMAASRAIPGLHRQDWLNAVIDELMRVNPITDADVSTAIERVNESYFAGATSC